MEFAVQQTIEALSTTPRVLRSMFGDLSDARVHNRYGADTFSPFDVVGHLIHGERTDWMRRARMILESGEGRPFPAFDRYAMFEDSRNRSLTEPGMCLTCYAATTSVNSHRSN